jgi:F-type H+-transporting ATPase subunit gamma
MPSLIDIRRRVRSVKNMQQITKAMKMVSAAKLRRAQENALAARPYSLMLGEMLANVAQAAAQDPDSTHDLLTVRPEKKILMVVMTADSGLAGGFNANLLKLAQKFINDHPNAEISVEAIGRKGRDYFRRRSIKMVAEHTDVLRVVKYDDADRIATKIIERFSNAEVDAVYLFVNEFKSVMAPHLEMKRLLPIEVPATNTTVNYLYEQPPQDLLGSLLPRYVKLQIYRALLETFAAYQAARMTAMDAATSNASDMIEKLTLYMNRVRQASITREIIEIVSGSAALD